jgi:hypothetical protein
VLTSPVVDVFSGMGVWRLGGRGVGAGSLQERWESRIHTAVMKAGFMIAEEKVIVCQSIKSRTVYKTVFSIQTFLRRMFSCPGFWTTEVHVYFGSHASVSEQVARHRFLRSL